MGVRVERWRGGVVVVRTVNNGGGDGARHKFAWWLACGLPGLRWRSENEDF